MQHSDQGSQHASRGVRAPRGQAWATVPACGYAGAREGVLDLGAGARGRAVCGIGPEATPTQLPTGAGCMESAIASLLTHLMIAPGAMLPGICRHRVCRGPERAVGGVNPPRSCVLLLRGQWHGGAARRAPTAPLTAASRPRAAPTADADIGDAAQAVYDEREGDPFGRLGVDALLQVGAASALHGPQSARAAASARPPGRSPTRAPPRRAAGWPDAHGHLRPFPHPRGSRASHPGGRQLRRAELHGQRQGGLADLPPPPPPPASTSSPEWPPSCAPA